MAILAAVLQRVVVVLLALSPAGFALAQTGVNGSIVGSVFDQAGVPIKGVKITASSPTQIGGKKVTYSDDEGNFRMVGLLPGVFEVAATAPKLRTVVQKAINVGISSAAEVNLIMEVETSTEEIKVVEKAPVISTNTAGLKEVLDSDFIDALPQEGRFSIEGAIANATAGVVNKGGSLRINGGGTRQNMISVDGFQISSTQDTGVKSVAALEVQTAGYGAENANAPGGVINMVTKSGSNKLELDISAYYDDQHMRFFRDASDVAAPVQTAFFNPAVSGPIIKDRLWYYAVFQLRRNITAREKDPSGNDLTGDPPSRSDLRTVGSLKLTWQVTPRNKVSSYTSLNRHWLKNQADPLTYDRDAQYRTDSTDIFQGLIWEALLSDNLFLRSQVGVQESRDMRQPMRCSSDPIDCDNIPQLRNSFPRALRLNNNELHQQTIKRSVEVVNQLEWFANSKTWGDHNVKLRSRVFDQLTETAETTPGDYYVQYRGTVPELIRHYYANDPRLDDQRFGWSIRGTSGLTTIHSLSDSMRITRYLTVTPGGAYTTARAANVGQGANIDGSGFTPHLSAAWDATHDGRTVIRGSYNQYVDIDALTLAQFALGSRVYRECRWDAATEDFTSNCVYGGGRDNRTFGLPCGPSGVDESGQSCSQRLKMPRTHEYTAGVEREVIQGLAMGADLVYRLYTFPYETRETNRLWGPSGYVLDPNGGFRNGKAETIDDLGTPDSARRRYLGVTATMRKREGKFKFLGSYTWSRLEGNVDNNEGNDFGTVPARDRYYLYGFLPDDRRHVVKTSMTFQLTTWMSVGLGWRYLSGAPYQRRFRNDVLGAFNDYRAQVGINPAGNINDPDDDRPLRLPDRQEMNAQVRFNLKPLTGINLDLNADIINLLALRTTTTVQEQDGPVWSQPSARMETTRIRVGLRYRY